MIISKYKNIFSERYAPNWSEEVFVISKIRNTVPWTYDISDFNGERIGRELFMKKNFKRLTKNNLE